MEILSGTDFFPDLLVRFYLGKNSEAHDLARAALILYFAGILGQGWVF